MRSYKVVMMNSYQKEQLETLSLVLRHLANASAAEKKSLVARTADYLLFRNELDVFLKEHFSNLCTQKCFQNKMSACCSRDGIITFFADVLINTLISSENEIRTLARAIQNPNDSLKCIYLGKQGCLWRVKPIVCEMFLCDTAIKDVLAQNPSAEASWQVLQERRKRFTWPDRPVLFDDLERYFIDAGHSSALMYFHNSPGLLKIKKQAEKRT